MTSCLSNFEQISIFDIGKTPLKIGKPVRLIELFAGVGSQAKALERLGVDFEHYRISEWEVSAVASYKAIHKGKDNTDYSNTFSNEELTDLLYGLGVSTDGKRPLSRKEIARRSEQWKREVYNNFVVTNNIGSIVNICGNDLGIVDTDKYCYIMTYSFPCQDLSLAGLQKGMAKGGNTRSGLLWEVERLLNECEKLPQILLMENVTQVHGKKNLEHFREWIEYLESKGYSNYLEDLNAKNYGIPQNRDRTFMVSVLGDYTYAFPKPIPLELRLKDMLEGHVEKKYYVSDVALKGFVEHERKQREKGNNFKATFKEIDDIASAIKARYYKDGSDCLLKVGSINSSQEGVVVSAEGISPTHTSGPGNTPKIIEEPSVKQIGNLFESKTRENPNQGRLYDKNGLSPTLGTMQGGNRQPFIVDNPRVIGGIGERKSNGGTQWYQQDRIYDNEIAMSVTTGFLPFYKTEEPAVWDGYNQHIRAEKGTVGTLTQNCGADLKRNGYGIIEPLAYDEQNGYIRKDGTVGTLTTDVSSPKHNNRVVEGVRIRKLTPKECWRLMGFDDADFDKAAKVNLNAQLYKQAGNSIVVDVLVAIFRNMF